MAMVKLAAQKREEAGKGASRRARRAGLVPAVVYGREIETQSLVVPGHEIFMIAKNNPNAIINLDVEGEKLMVLLKEVQRHRVRRDILHVDFLAVNRNDTVEVEVPVVLVGEPAPGCSINQEVHNLMVAVSPLDIPEQIEVSVEGLPADTVMRASELKLPAGMSHNLDPETDVLSVRLEAPAGQEEAEEAAE